MDAQEMIKWQSVSGVPGAGKTFTLVAATIQAAKTVGPEQIAAVTFSRAAAEELRQRIADALGIQGDQRTLRRRIPFVGTIHSIAMALAGVSTRNMVDGKKLRLFSNEYTGSDLPAPEEADNFFLGEPGLRTDAISAMIWLSSASRHREWAAEDVLPLIDPKLLSKIGPDRLIDLLKEYYAWKEETGYHDFEDLLCLGQRIPLPVKFLAVDEAQDCSPLLWKTVNSWGHQDRVQSYIACGDPFQAIFSYMGASPHLFIERPGRWHRLLVSRRFSQENCDYARQIVHDVFGTKADFLNQWTGTGISPSQGDSFFLARTGSLVSRKAGELLSDGVPFRYLRGGRGPLSTRSADAFRTILRLQRGDLVGQDELLNLAEQATSQDARAAKTVLTPIRALPDGYYGLDTARAHLPEPLLGVSAPLEQADYYRDVVRQHGEQAMFRIPKLALGTVHSAKGRECDNVTLCTSWARRPAQNITRDPESEACVSYVGCTRHRNSLTLEDVMDGGRQYPFPAR